jgi:AraC-like DNA-binding protein
MTHPNARPIVVDTPSIIFLPRPHQHRLHASEEEGTELVCATIEFGTGMLNPLTASFPEPFVIPIDTLPELAPTLELLFSESSSDLPGRQTALDRLFEYVLVLLFRSAMNMRLVDSGVLLGLSDPRLSKAIEVMHRHPERSWSLEELAQQAGMSRARFAAHFRKVVGTTPFDYLTNWRLGIAQTMLRKRQLTQTDRHRRRIHQRHSFDAGLHPAPRNLTDRLAPLPTRAAPCIAAKNPPLDEDLHPYVFFAWRSYNLLTNHLRRGRSGESRDYP